MNIKKNLLATLLVAIICLSSAAYVLPAQANPGAPTINVHKGDSIQAAIDAANVGAKIFVHKGTYTLTEPLHVNKAVALIGKDATIQYTKTNYAGLTGMAAIFVEANGVEISDLTINVQYGGAPSNPGIITAINVGNAALSMVSYCTIDNNVVDSPNWGVSGYRTTGVVVENNVISAQHPIWFTSATSITIENNDVTAKNYPTSPAIDPTQKLLGVLSAIKVPACNGATIINNQVNSEDYGIIVAANGYPLTAPSNVMISGNQILSSVNGIYSDRGSNFEVTNNIVYAQKNGIWLNDMQGTSAIVSGNTVTCGLTPIYLGNAA